MKTALGPDRLGFQEAVGQGAHLFSEKFGGTVVQENMVCQLALSGQWQLLDQALAGEFRGNAALLQPPQLRRRACGHAHGEIKPILQAFFEEQRHLDDESFALGRREHLPPARQQPRMQQVFQPLELDRIGKNHFSHPAAPYPPFAIDDFRPKAIADRPDYGGISEDFVPNHLIGIQTAESTLGKQGGGR